MGHILLDGCYFSSKKTFCPYARVRNFHYLCIVKNKNMGFSEYMDYVPAESERCSVAASAPLFSVDMITFFILLYSRFFMRRLFFVY